MRPPHWADDPTSADDCSRMVDDAADEARDRAYLADDGQTTTATNLWADELAAAYQHANQPGGNAA